jgi:hypothetical protein
MAYVEANKDAHTKIQADRIAPSGFVMLISPHSPAKTAFQGRRGGVTPVGRHDDFHAVNLPEAGLSNDELNDTAKTRGILESQA